MLLASVSKHPFLSADSLQPVASSPDPLRHVLKCCFIPECSGMGQTSSGLELGPHKASWAHAATWGWAESTLSAGIEPEATSLISSSFKAFLSSVAHHNVTYISDGSMVLVYAESLSPPFWKSSVLITFLYTQLFTADEAKQMLMY